MAREMAVYEFDITRSRRSRDPLTMRPMGEDVIKGKSVAERARALIGISHPDFREGLERQAYEHRLIPQGVSF